MATQLLDLIFFNTYARISVQVDTLYTIHMCGNLQTSEIHCIIYTRMRIYRIDLILMVEWD
jgi:hypothetical protein